MASAIPDGGGEITLDSEDVQTWLKALTDVRLYLGVRLGIATEEDVEAIRAAAARDESLATAVHVYDWLTYIQDSLVRAAWEEE